MFDHIRSDRNSSALCMNQYHEMFHLNMYGGILNKSFFYYRHIWSNEMLWFILTVNHIFLALFIFCDILEMAIEYHMSDDNKWAANVRPLPWSIFSQWANHIMKRPLDTDHIQYLINKDTIDKSPVLLSAWVWLNCKHELCRKVLLQQETFICQNRNFTKCV